MKTHTIRLVMCLLMVGAVTSCGKESSDTDVKVVSWGGTFQSDLMTSWVAPAAKDAQLNLQTEAWDGDYGALTTRIRRGLNNWDLVHVELFYVLQDNYQDLFESYPQQQLEIVSDLIRKDQSGGELIRNGYAAPVLEYGYVVAGHPINGRPASSMSWQDFWDTKKFPGHRGLRDFPVGNIEAALASLGYDPVRYLYREKDPGKLRIKVQEALQRLDELSPNILWWKSGDDLQQGLVSGDYQLAAAWSGRVLAAYRKLCKPATVPEDCPISANPATALISTDWWIIPKNAPHKENAARLLKYMFARAARDGAIQFSEKQGYAAPISDFKVNDAVANTILRLGSSANHGLARIDERFWSKNYDQISMQWKEWRANAHQ